jgi:poly(3-hydroxybutyrate) depolymerase
MKIQYLFTLLFVVTLMAPSFSQTTIDASMTHDGLNRTYRLYIPESYNSNTPVPLLLNLHGYTSNNIQQEFYGDFRLLQTQPISSLSTRTEQLTTVEISFGVLLG